MLAPKTFAHALARARQFHPQIAVRDHVVCAWARERLPAGAGLDQSQHCAHAADVLLACGCTLGDPGTLKSFEHTETPGLAAAIGGTGARADEIDEVVQRLRERLLVGTADKPPQIERYRAEGSLRGWLRVVAIREVLSARRRKHVDPLADLHADLLALVDVVAVDPELEVIKANASAEFRAAFSAAFEAMSDREKNVLKYHALDGLTGQQVGRMYGVDRSTVIRWLAKARHELLRGTRERLTHKLQLDREGFESLMRMIASRLDMSLGGVHPRRGD